MINVLKTDLIKTNKYHKILFLKKSKASKNRLMVKIFRVYLVSFEKLFLFFPLILILDEKKM